MDGPSTWTDCDEAGDYVVFNVLSPRDLVFRPDNLDETVPHTYCIIIVYTLVDSTKIQSADQPAQTLKSYTKNTCFLNNNVQPQ